MMARAPARRLKLPFDWQLAENRTAQADAIHSAVRDLVRADQGEVPLIDVIWSAGTAGFASSEAEAGLELRAFADVLDLSRRLHDLAASSQFHLLSSAGGLFEGQRHVDASSTPAPLRPYGFAKLEQEAAVRRLPAGMATLIYRPSSVYGYVGGRARKGLVAVLVLNAIRYGTTSLFGGPDTVRDYVFADDIGGFIADRVLGACRTGDTIFLASGKPTSTSELVAIVQNAMQRQLYVRFDPSRWNALSNSIRPSSLPLDWRPTPLVTGVFKTATRIIVAYRDAAR
jgi:UDP-glucose 4-epimerase